jgi:hypothetical protein
MSFVRRYPGRAVLAGLAIAGLAATGIHSAIPAAAATKAARACAWPGAYLTSVRTSHHADSDQVVFQFADAKPRVFTYTVSSVVSDPVGSQVPLAGQKYLLVRFRDASAVCIPTEHSTYAGPKTLSPYYPQLLTISESGDFEMQLSFGIGLAGQAGYHWYRLSAPDRVVLVLNHAALGKFPGVWPVTSWSQYWAAQYSWLNGHQPWLRDPAQVVAAYARARFHIEADVHRLSQATYWFTSQSGGRVTVTGTRPVRTSGPWIITHISGS